MNQFCPFHSLDLRCNIDAASSLRRIHPFGTSRIHLVFSNQITSTMRVIRTGLLFLLLAGLGHSALAQSAFVRGFVRDADDQAPLLGVNIVLVATDGSISGAASNSDGLFVIQRIMAGRYVLRATYIGYETHVDTLDIAVGDIVSYNITLNSVATGLEEVIVETDREGAGAAAIVAGLQTISPREIDLVPSPDISGDLVNYLTTQPGVVSVGDQGGQFFVRGGESTQNMVLLDGMLIYQPFHLIGFYSAFPSNIISVTDFHAGGFGAKYGGRLSSVISVSTRIGNKRRYEGEISVAPFVSGGRIEGPILKNRASLLLSGRFSVIEQGAERLISERLPYTFNDQFAKLHVELSPDSQISLTGLRTYDRGIIDPIAAADTLDPADQVIWKNQAYGMRFLLLPTSIPMQAEIILSSSQIENTFGELSEPSRTSSTSQFNVTANLVNYFGILDMHWGFLLTAGRMQSDLGGAFQGVSSDKVFVTEIAGYMEPEFGSEEGLRIRPGLRLQSFPSNSTKFLEPRVRAIFRKGVHQISGAWGIYHQEIVGLADRRDAGDIFTAWTTSPRLKVPEAMHAILGYQVKPTRSIQIAVEAYYKSLKNLSIAEWTAFPRFTTAFQPADGEVTGFDTRIELSLGRFYGFVNYGYSKVTYKASGDFLQYWFPTSTLEFSPPHDRRHQINVLAALQIAEFEVSVHWQFGSGLPFSRAFGFDEFVLLDEPKDIRDERGATRVLYDLPYDGRLPTYHRLDISIERDFKLSGRTRLALQIGLTNAYDRMNLFYIDLYTLRRLNQLPLIPSFGMKLEF